MRIIFKDLSLNQTPPVTRVCRLGWGPEDLTITCQNIDEYWEFEEKLGRDAMKVFLSSISDSGNSGHPNGLDNSNEPFVPQV